jgi:hypothetical protein
MWWQQERNIFRGVPLQGYPHNKVLWTDASKWGLGCTLGHSSGGRSVVEGIDQSSYQLARDENCMECFDRVSGGDSGTESAYQMRQCHSSGIYKQARGTKSIPLCLLLWDMMQWCLKHNIHIHAAHIPGKKNCLADTRRIKQFSCLTFIKTLGMSMGGGNAYANIPSQLTDSASHVHARGSG